MSITVDIDMREIDAMFSEANKKRVQTALSEAVGSDSNIFVPMDTGSLRGSMTVTEDGVEWRQSYAQPVYYMDNATTNWSTPETHSHWVEWAKDRYGEDWAKVVLSKLMEGAR